MLVKVQGRENSPVWVTVLPRLSSQMGPLACTEVLECQFKVS